MLAMKSILLPILAALAAQLAAADDNTIVDIAAGNEDFSTLVAAVQAAGLLEALNGDGPFTVFGTYQQCSSLALEVVPRLRSCVLTYLNCTFCLSKTK